MFKRANKITALAVAAAAVVSLVPATGANAAAKRLGNKEGTVKEGIAYDGGKYSYYGFRTDDDLTGIYSNSGSEATEKMKSELEDYRFDTLAKYGTKYAYAHEQSNNDEYLVDLSTGNIVSDETADEKRDTEEIDLANKLKKADRYNGLLDQNDKIHFDTFNQVLRGQFGEVWYQYTAKLDPNANANAVQTYKKVFTTTASAAIPQIHEAVSQTAADDAYDKALLAQVKAQKATDDALATLVAANDLCAVNNKRADLIPNSINTLADIQAQVRAIKAGIVGDGLAATKDMADAYVAWFIANTDLTPANKKLDDATTVKNDVEANNQGAIAYNTSLGITPAGNSAYTFNFLGQVGTIVASHGDFVDAGVTPTKVPTQDEVNAAYKAIADKVFAGTGATVTVANGNVEVKKAGDTKVTDAVYAKFALVGNASRDNETLENVVPANGDVLYTGFTNESGAYIDASYTANMKIFSTEKGRAVNVEHFDEEVKDAKITAHLEDLSVIAQDKDYLYAIAKVTVRGEGAVVDGTVDADGTPYGTEYFLQKISKAQGEKERGAITPKSVTSYQLDNGIYDNDDLQKPLDVISGSGSFAEGAADEFVNLLGITVKNGNEIYVTRAKDDKVKVYKFDLKSSTKNDVAKGTNLKTDVDTAAVKWNDAKDEEINNFTVDTSAAEDEGLKHITYVKAEKDEAPVTLFGQDLYRHPSVSIDVNGNTWSLKKNTITKFDGLDKKTDIYSVDGALDAIDVYDDNNLIAWDTDGDRYTNVTEGKTVTEGDGINVNPDLNKDKFKNGYYADEKKFYKDGTAVTNQWASDAAGKWYFLDASGVAKTGWYQNAAGKWFLLGTDGAMLTGWQQDGGNWYYLNPVNSDGGMVTGWFKDTTGTWYYTDGSGKMLSNTTVGGYTLGASGAWVQ